MYLKKKNHFTFRPIWKPWRTIWIANHFTSSSIVYKNEKKKKRQPKKGSHLVKSRCSRRDRNPRSSLSFLGTQEKQNEQAHLEAFVRVGCALHATATPGATPEASLRAPGSPSMAAEVLVPEDILGSLYFRILGMWTFIWWSTFSEDIRDTAFPYSRLSYRQLMAWVKVLGPEARMCTAALLPTHCACSLTWAPRAHQASLMDSGANKVLCLFHGPGISQEGIYKQHPLWHGTWESQTLW